MTSYLSYGYSKPSSVHSTSSNTLKKKIKHFSYSSNDKIGKGFSSIVYKGTNDNTNQTVAIKAIDMKGVKDSISRQMLDCQIQALTTLNHNNILKCYDVVRQLSHCYIITQFCNQGDLSELVKKKRRMNQSQTLKILKDIVSGFVEMGQKKFLHRDLKLANIFMSQGNAIIADFGFAKKHTNGPQREKYNVGSPLYMSPEALKKNIYSIKNDIWSIGIMAFEMLHGETPWECRTQKQLIDKMTRIPIKFRDSLNISSPTKNFITKCLKVDEKQRMSLQDLKQWLQGEPMKNISTNNDQLPLIRKPFSNIQNLMNPLNQISSKLSSREQKSRSLAGHYINMDKQKQAARDSFKSKQNKVQNKQNNNKGVSLVSINKSIIQANNNILVIQINVFRLLYKIIGKIQKYQPSQTEIVKILSNQVLKRVKKLKSFTCDPDENGKTKSSLQYGIRQAQSYLDQLKNASIKKYKSVVKQYYKKYTTELKYSQLQNQSISFNQAIKSFLKQKQNKLSQSISSEQLMYIYWMIEFVQMKRDVKKEYLDEVIDPKNVKLTKEYIQDRIREIYQKRL